MIVYDFLRKQGRARAPRRDCAFLQTYREISNYFAKIINENLNYILVLLIRTCDLRC